MTRFLPLEIHISDLAFFGFLLFFPAAGFLLLALILFLAKYKKGAKMSFIIGGCCLLIASGLCGFAP